MSATLKPRTWIAPEEDAYNTARGGHARSGRKGRVWFPDNVIRTVTLGVPDTYFTIPAHGRVQGHYVVGFVTMVEDDLRPYNAPVEYEFRPYSNYWHDSNGAGDAGAWQWTRG